MASEYEADWHWVELALSKLSKVPGVTRDREFVPEIFPDAVPHSWLE